MHLAALVYLAAALLWWRTRRYPLWSLWLLVWGAVLMTWAPDNAAWGRTVYTPLLIASTVLTALMTFEAFFAHAAGSPLMVRLSVGLAFLGIAAGWAVLHYYPVARNTGAVAREWALCVRVGCTVFLLLDLAAWESLRLLRWNRETAHLVVVTLMVGSFAGGSFALGHVDRSAWFSMDTGLQWGRVALLATWIAVIPAWSPVGRYALGLFRGGLGVFRSARWLRVTAAPRRS